MSERRLSAFIERLSLQTSVASTLDEMTFTRLQEIRSSERVWRPKSSNFFLPGAPEFHNRPSHLADPSRTWLKRVKSWTCEVSAPNCLHDSAIPAATVEASRVTGPAPASPATVTVLAFGRSRLPSGRPFSLGILRQWTLSHGSASFRSPECSFAMHWRTGATGICLGSRSAACWARYTDSCKVPGRLVSSRRSGPSSPYAAGNVLELLCEDDASFRRDFF